jgi:hypothetical protein
LICDAEYGRADANAERKKQQRDGGERETLPEYAQAVTKVLQGGFQARETTGIAAFVFRLAERAELKPRHPFGLFESKTGAPPLFNLAFQVKTEFVVEIGVGLVSLE